MVISIAIVVVVATFASVARLSFRVCGSSRKQGHDQRKSEKN
jgi:hypothetical protein